MISPDWKAACLVIDMQNGFAHPDSRMGRAVGVSPQQAAIPVITQLVAFCRDAGVPLFWSQQVHFPEDTTRQRRRLPSHASKQGFLPCLRGTWETEFEDHIRPLVRPEDYVIEKHRSSVFYDTSFERKLKMLDVRMLLIAGCNTEFCVESTVRDAYARDFEVVVIKDAVAGIRPEFHEASLAVMQAYFGEVTPFSALPGLLARL
jgi:ureidoacrylate peracid hydrolase